MNCPATVAIATTSPTACMAEPSSITVNAWSSGSSPTWRAAGTYSRLSLLSRLMVPKTLVVDRVGAEEKSR